MAKKIVLKRGAEVPLPPEPVLSETVVSAEVADVAGAPRGSCTWGRYEDGKAVGFEPFGGSLRRRMENGWAFGWFVGAEFCRALVGLEYKELSISAEMLVMVPSVQRVLSPGDPVKVSTCAAHVWSPLGEVPYEVWAGWVAEGAVVSLGSEGRYRGAVAEFTRQLGEYVDAGVEARS